MSILDLLRLDQPLQPDPDPVDVKLAKEEPQHERASDGTLVTIHPDGTVEIGGSLPVENTDRKRAAFGANLAEHLDQQDLSALAYELLEGIEADIAAQAEAIADHVAGLDMLGIKKERPARSAAGGDANISVVRHPILLEAVLKFQAQARAELLPASGPVKIETEDGDDASTVMLAEHFEDDFNYYLTKVAKEYYPDTDRGLFYLAFGGCVFKKVYHCPIRRRPVSEVVHRTDLFVTEGATDLDNAVRVTHRTTVTPVTLRRLQVSGAYLDIVLDDPSGETTDQMRGEARVGGLSASASRPEDRARTIYECHVSLDPHTYGLPAERGAPDRLPLPYRITIDHDSRKILEVRRNWKRGDSEFLKKTTFIKWGLIPGPGFYDLGYLHLLQNSTSALTAGWRIMVDGGMFSNFPGGVRAKGARPGPTVVRPHPGEWPEIDIGGMDDIRKALMAMPYNPPSPTFWQMLSDIGNQARTMAGAANIDTGEGKTNVPVGTIMANIEQQTKIEAAIHARLHVAQAEELEALRELFVEDPAALTRLARKPARVWKVAAEFADLDLRPVSDPNIPSHIHRLMQGTALAMLAEKYPQYFDGLAVLKRLLRLIRVNDPDSLVHPPAPMAAPGKPGADPVAAQAKMAQVQVSQMQQQREAAQTILEGKVRMAELQQESADRGADRESRERVAKIKFDTEMLRLQHQAETQRLAHQHDEATAAAQRDHEQARHDAELSQDDRHHAADLKHKRELARSRDAKQKGSGK